MNRFSVVLLIAALFFLGASAQTTEPIQDPSTLHCYQVVSSTVTAANFSQALLFANESISNTGLNGYLATISTQAELDFVNGLVNERASEFWIGASVDANGTAYVWQNGPEKDGVVLNATGCQLVNGCFGLTSVLAGTGVTFFNGTFVAADETMPFGYIIEFDGCLASPSPSSSPSAAPTTTTTGGSTGGSTTSGASVSPSTFRPTITLGTLTTGKKTTTGRKTTTGKKATTGRRATTGKVSAASSMSFSAFAVAFAAVSMLFLRR